MVVRCNENCEVGKKLFGNIKTIEWSGFENSMNGCFKYDYKSAPATHRIGHLKEGIFE
jgi:hypothetical protein